MIGGPAASGILCGRGDLVAAAALQQLDLDVYDHLWRPPAGLIDRAALGGPPRHGVGRVTKVGKEQIVGLLTALDLFVREGDAVRHARWRGIVEEIAERLAEGGQLAASGIALELSGLDDTAAVPRLVLRLPPGRREAAAALVTALEDGRPPVHVAQGDHLAGVLTFNPVCLVPGDAAAVAGAVRAALAACGLVPASGAA